MGNVCSLGWRLDDHELEQTYRSLVMVGKGRTLGWSSDQALELVENLQAARRRITELEAAYQRPAGDTYR